LLTAARISPLEAVFVLALSTGARRGEILALQPTDYHHGKLDIRRTLVNNSTSIDTPKSNNSRRTIQLPTIARNTLEKYLEQHDGSVWTFSSKAGTMVLSRLLSRGSVSEPKRGQRPRRGSAGWQQEAERLGVELPCDNTMPVTEAELELFKLVEKEYLELRRADGLPVAENKQQQEARPEDFTRSGYISVM
jgi:hypothetical protein